LTVFSDVEVEGRFEPVRASTTANVGAFVSLPSTKPMLKAPSPVEFNGKLFSTWQVRLSVLEMVMTSI